MPHTKGTAGENKTNEGASCEFLGSHGAGPSRMHPWRDRAKPLIKGRLPLLFGVCLFFIERRKRPYRGPDGRKPVADFRRRAIIPWLLPPPPHNNKHHDFFPGEHSIIFGRSRLLRSAPFHIPESELYSRT